MNLRYILGLPGSGKTTRCVDEIISAVEKGRHSLYIVPEQLSLESEKMLTSKCRNNIMLGSEVISFAHLAHRLITETGGSSEKILDDNSKVLLLRRIINNLAKDDKLLFYGKGVSRYGFVDGISSIITEFTRNSVSPNELITQGEKFNENNPGLTNKLHDIAVIYDSFQQNLKDRFIAKDELLDVLAKRIPQSDMFKDTDVWIDSFTDFTPQEFRVIEALSNVCDTITITFTVNRAGYDNIDALNPFDPYFEAKRSMRAIAKLPSIKSIKPEIIIVNDGEKYSLAPDLKHLSYNFFSGKKYQGQAANIKIFSANSIDDELNNMCKEIYHLIKDKGYTYSDMAVMISSDNYNLPLKSIFSRNNIPFFTDTRRNILSHPLTELIRSVFNVIISNNGLNEVIGLFRTGFNELTCDEISFIENYCIVSNIKGKKWYDDWTNTISGNYTEEQMNDLNDIRAYIADVLGEINTLKNVKRYKVSYISEKIYGMKDVFNISDKLNELINEARNNGDEEAARIHTQIWDVIWSVFSRMCNIMGDDEVTVAEFYRMLDTGFQNITMGLIPSTCNSITVASFNRSRLPNIKALFMLGVNEGIIPPYHDDTNLLSDNDRAALLAEGLELGGDNIRLINRDRYTIYSYMAKPSEKLYLSYNSDLESGIPSALIQDIKYMFDLTEENSNTSLNIDDIYSKEYAFDILTDQLAKQGSENELSPLCSSIYRYFANSRDIYGERIEKVRNWLVKDDATETGISPETAAKLYLNGQSEMIQGITSIEDYYKCPFMYYLSHGIRAYDRKTEVPEVFEYGTLLHGILKDFSDRLTEQNISWDNIDEESIYVIIDELIEKQAEVYRGGFFGFSKTNNYLKQRLKDILINTIKTISSNLGKFTPCDYEVAFGKDDKRPFVFNLEDGIKLVLTGSIDRVDRYIDPQTGEIYIKILDYKSSSSTSDTFSKKEMDAGIRLQLPLYLSAYLLMNKNALPGGFFYFKVDNPVVDSKFKNMYDRLISGGAVIDNEVVLKALSEDEKSELNKNNDNYIKLSVPYNEFMENINNKIIEAGQNIISGNVKAEPNEIKDQCKYCSYSAICRYELYGKSINDDSDT